jgi:myosin heavy subunit
LVFSLFFWVLFGWFADYSFPYGQALELLLACFKGTVSAKINSLQKQLQRIDIVSQPDNQQQVQKLNNLESQAWLYEGILERLGEDPSANHEKIARTLEALEYKRNEILQELEPRRPQKYRILAKIQDYTRSLLASQAEKDYIKLERIVTNLVLFARSRQPSQIILSEVIERLAVEIAQNANQISPYRLRLAYKIDDLIRILSAKLVLGANSSKTDSTYQALVNELRSRINLLSEQFNSLLRTRQENGNDLNKRIQEISNLTRNISDLHRDISARDASIAALQKNIQDLTEIDRSKQAQINNLQNSIANLQREVENSTELNQRKQNQINELKKQVDQLNQQRLELQQRIRDVAELAQNKQFQIENLQDEKSQFISQKLELQKQYQILLQQYQQQQKEIADLKAQIKNISQINRSQPFSSTYTTPQQPVKRVETKPIITVEEYEKISNQTDYVYVDTYYRKDGTRVRGHYRRRPNR